MSQQKITVLEAMKILSSSWGELSAQTIKNFLKKAGISDSSQPLAQWNADDALIDLELELDNLKELYHTAVQDNLSGETFIHLDNKGITTASVPINKEILPYVLAGDNNDELQPGDFDVDIWGLKGPSWEQGALVAICIFAVARMGKK